VYRPVERIFFARDAVTVARELLGMVLVRRTGQEVLAARIVETEAYRGDDPASHSFGGPTGRSQVMFGPPGHAYVYLIYGIHECFNVVCEPQGAGAAVLVRVAEPISGRDVMGANRFERAELTEREVHNLTSGPGKLCQAFGIHRREHDGADLCGGPDAPGEIRVGTPAEGWPVPDGEVSRGSRIGISKATERPWRFWIRDNVWVSR
jgi:DNA-3-methyladenine glycosylase